MKFHALLGAAIAAGTLFVTMQGCTTNGEATAGISCTPGNYVFCRCADRTEGTKLCKDDGASFEACTTGASGECAGGEDLTDPRTGEDVEPPTEKPPEEAGPPGSPVDACPGKPTAVTPGPDIVVDGDTTAAKDDVKGRQGACAAGDGGSDHVYRLQPTGSGALSIKVKGEGALNPLIYLRSTCDDVESQTACAPPLGAAGLVQVQTNVVAGRDYYLVVDGASGSAGKYKLTMKLVTGSFCGDGKVDSNEACDDGNKVEGDGCSNGCNAVNGNPAGGDCTAPHVVHMWKGKTVSGTGSTLSYSNSFAEGGALCSPTLANPAPDHVYEVTSHAAGTLKVTLTPTDATAYKQPQLLARTTCSLASTMSGCTENGASPVTMAIPVQNNQKVYVAATGILASSGTYTIKFELP